MSKFFSKKYFLRTIVVLIAHFMGGMGLALLRFSCLGTDPFSSMCFNLSFLFNMPISPFLFGFQLFLFLILFKSMKSYIGIGTIINMTLYGVSADIWQYLLLRFTNLRESYSGTSHLVFRLLLMFFGIFMILFFLSFYLASDTGMSPYDAFAYILESKFKNIPYKYFRIMSDVLCFIFSFIFGIIGGNPWTVIGFATIITAFFTGPLFTFFRTKYAEPFFKIIS